ncbi:glycosyltransferase family 2 protein [Chryseobacterium sp. SC28]|uniref:glycosyltransferase family 2 protein n=1 Tax=Chryseobacterium sp. SC28 TaxID=2268028 RepID=UPI000F651407|nr:glycosyltransferase [Chryseobacterium sp. SC28]RRQ45844.1 glycosyltransferase [Chryseobacterium sp. SC28]
MPFYSIIIPTYNSEKTLAAALESVLQQRFSDFEVLIMDGLSSSNFEMGGLSSSSSDVFFRNEKRSNILEYYKFYLHAKEFDSYYIDMKVYILHLIQKHKPKALYYFLILMLKRIQIYGK